MEIQIRIENDFKTAFKSGDEVSKRTLRMVLASIKLVEVENGRALTDEEVLSIVQKEIKSLRESISDAEKAGRDDLIAEAEPEIQILEQYTPQQLDEDEITELARQAIEEVGATSQQEMGKVMKVLMPRVQGRADGSKVSASVRTLLTTE
ncbi:MAG: GatB/YqeY domain-containing protein [Anaerolineales bacterium]|nr:GatB/YqeY domain-containing protein [Anaerolineales bacterium]